MAHLELTVLGDRVVQRHDRRNLLLDAEDPVAEALVVVNEVEVAGAAFERLEGTDAERERFAEDAGGELRRLHDVAERLDLPEPWEPTRMVVVEEVEARELVEWHPLVEHRVGLAAVHLDVMAEIDQRLRQVTGVDTLPPDVRLATVCQVGDSERTVRVHGRRHGGRAYRRALPPSN